MSAEYEPKGTYEDLAGLKTYTIGPDKGEAKAAVLVIYDVFGFSPQIVQGGCRVVVGSNNTASIPGRRARVQGAYDSVQGD